MQDHSTDPVWKQAIAGSQMLLVAFGALVLMPLITGLDPNVALFTAGIGTLIFHIVTGGQIPIFLASSFAFIAPIIAAKGRFGLEETLGGLMAAGILHIILSGAVRLRGTGFITRLLPPVVIGPVIMVIGLGLADLFAAQRRQKDRQAVMPGQDARLAQPGGQAGVALVECVASAFENAVDLGQIQRLKITAIVDQKNPGVFAQSLDLVPRAEMVIHAVRFAWPHATVVEQHQFLDLVGMGRDESLPRQQAGKQTHGGTGVTHVEGFFRRFEAV